VLGVLVAGLIGSVTPIQAEARQKARSDSLCKASSIPTVQEGIDALDDDPGRAVQLLQSVTSADPGCYTEAHGSAAYWLGVASGESGNRREQLEAWKEGVAAVLGSERPLDVRLANAYIHRVFSTQRGIEYQQATRAYLALLNQAGRRPLAAWEEPLLAQQLRLVAVLLPPAIRQRTGLQAPIDPPTVSALPAQCGRELVAWWRGQDPLPATPANERLEEHLERVTHAKSQFETDGRIDERGEIYVRLGAPSRQTTIQFNSIRFNESALSFDSRFSMSDFKSGQFWVYDGISRATQYLFIEDRRGVYEIGDVVSMFPQSLQRGFSSSPRGQEAAAVFVRAMAEAYSQLAVYHDRYHSLNQRLSNYTLDLDAGTTGSVTRGTRTVLNFARRTLLDVKQSDVFHRQQRERSTPRVHSGKPAPYQTIPVAVRHARFLRPNGSTQVEVYWSAAYNELAGASDTEPPDRYLIATSMVQRGDDGQPLTTRYRSNVVEAGRADGTAVLSPQTYRLSAQPQQAFRIDLQWDQYEAEAETRTPRPGEIMGRYIWQSDTLRALDPNPDTLLLSDIRPMVVPSGMEGGALDEAALPYPFRFIGPETSLALYFEVYHLAFDATDRTRYTVEYEVRRQAPGEERPPGPARGDDTPSTATTAQYEGTTRTAKEYVLLDLSAWEGQRDLTVTVRVTDTVTGQAVQRSIDFDASR
jgi:GWxTD domain-containing protein